MNTSKNLPLTPIYLKIDEEADLPKDKVFYLLSREGLFLCRNHDFFSSCVRADRWPAELAAQQPFLKIEYPRLNRRLVEVAVGFFDIVAEYYDSEAAVLLVWNRNSKQVELVVPKQVGTVGTSYYGDRYPIDLSYEIPGLSPHQMLIGDIHSHVNGLAYSSWTDKADEAYRPGLHVVVGRLQQEPPEFCCDVTADGERFPVKDLSLVMDDYQERRRDEVPDEWIDQVSVEDWSIYTPYSAQPPERKALGLGILAKSAIEEVAATSREKQECSVEEVSQGVVPPQAIGGGR